MADTVDSLESASESVNVLESSINEYLSVEIGTPLQANFATAEDWRKALSTVVPAVVVLRTIACRAFDTESAGVSSATGFVVDKRRGIILTNRHVVKPGPVVAEAIFLNREEVTVYPVYRDPVHDFGFYRYDPNAVQFLNYEEIPLAPEAACVGLEIRVVGNDSGEKVSILAGTIARLDRDAPHYKKDGYNDFNTFYMQAASGTKGGSSGSPVIDCQGRAVALNAGSNVSTSSAFFLPLESVVRALKYLQNGRDLSPSNWPAITIPRGTLEATFVHKGFDEIRRLGLQKDSEMLVRHASPPGETGMLVVDSVVPGGPAHKRLETGDVLIRVNGEVLTQFLSLTTLLDENVNQKIELQIERGSTPMVVDLKVQDLHMITPNCFLEVSGAVIHPLSYQQARNFRFDCGLVYVADPGYMLHRAGVHRHSIIKKFAGEEISCLKDLISVLSKLCRGARVPLEYVTNADRHRRKSVLVTVDRQDWYAPPLIYTRNDCTGLWDAEAALPSNCPLLLKEKIPSDTKNDCVIECAIQNNTQKLDGHSSSTVKSYEHISDQDNCMESPLHEINDQNTSDSDIPRNELEQDCVGADLATSTNSSLAERVVEPALVMFEVHVPASCMLDGVHSQHFLRTGVVIHHSGNLGLAVVDKNTVVISASDVMLSFAAFPMEIPGEVIFLHPVHNYALIAYDPSVLGPAGASMVHAAELLPEPALRRGDNVYLIGLSKSLQATSRKSIVTNPSAALNVGSADCPRYRAINMEVVELDTDFGSTFSGVLTDELGRVQAIWGSFSMQMKYAGRSSSDRQFVKGIPIYTISQVLDKILSGAHGPPCFINGIKRSMPLVRILEVEFYPTLLSKARSFGLTDYWIQALVKKDPVKRQVLRVKGCLAGSRAESTLEQCDMVLAINKEPITCFRDIEDACQELDKDESSDGKLCLTIFRQGQEMEVMVGTDVRDGHGTVRVINWCGSIVQDPHPAVRALGFLPEQGHGVYVSRSRRGSPVDRYGLYGLQWIVEINEKPTPDLDTFLSVTKELKHGEFVRVRTIHLNGKPKVLTLKQDLHYWPTWELRLDTNTGLWSRTTFKEPGSSVS